MRVILIDDEKHCRDGLAIMLEKYCPGVEVVAQCSNAGQGLKSINDLKPDLIFLDIEMPDMNGFEMLEYCRDAAFDIIFTTAYNEYAIQAIRHSALDYLLKPLNKQELINAVARAEENKNKQIAPGLDKLLELMGSKKIYERIALPDSDGLVMVDTKDIVYCESENNYTRFHLIDNKTVFISKTLKRLELLLEKDESFFRIHNSYIINLNFLQRYIKGDGGEVVMTTGQTLSVSRIKKGEFLERLDKL